MSEEFLEWYGNHRKELGLTIDALDAALNRGKRDRFEDIQLRIPRSQVDYPERNAPPKSALQKRLEWIATTLQLPERETRILGATVRLTQLEAYQGFREAFCNESGDSDEVGARTLLRVCGLRQADAVLFGASGILTQLGLLENRRGGDFAASKTLLKVLSQRSTKEGALTSALLGNSVPSRLALADFDHLGIARTNVLSIVSGALQAKEPGVGILFYGPPGTGKTEFARLLGQEVGAHVVFVGESSADVAEPSRSDRIAHLALLSTLAHRAGRVILVVDEADDIFTGIDDEDSSNRSGSKVFMNRVVEGCSVPTIWISNFPERLGQSIVRRMLHAVQFPEPDTAARLRIVARLAQSTGLQLEASDTKQLAALAAPPAVVESGLRAARLAGGQGALAVASTRSVLKALGRGGVPAEREDKPEFDLGQSSADMDLVMLASRIEAVGTSPLSFLFSGLPGTGKSAFARFLAAKLGMETLEKRGSDLFGMYVGETEKRIAEAFAEAGELGKFLILDEVDSLLADRRGAQRSWEVSQVNEILTWMECHPLPFAATTNLIERLDPATQRRFTFKVNFKPMHQDQAMRAFRSYFGCEPPECLRQLHPLTPGDFALVRRKALVLGESAPAALVGMLATEVEAKLTQQSRPIGFAAAI
ncbi:ATP-binding protein [Devosia sp. 919]|uniref:AAA family ATPase n=1 Tax=Devosia sp. 919 TaxID=2726065 RepID=UPI001557610C|nr:ATP-binding protein [Devosia sp. 919]